MLCSIGNFYWRLKIYERSYSCTLRPKKGCLRQSRISCRNRKTEQFYNLSKDDKKALFIDVHGVLKHQYILKLEIDTIFPEFAMNDDSSMLLSIALFEMRRAKSEEERTNILNEIVETFKERGISLNDETIKNSSTNLKLDL